MTVVAKLCVNRYNYETKMVIKRFLGDLSNYHGLVSERLCHGSGPFDSGLW